MANMSKTKCPMPSQDPLVRAGNFQEVALGYTEEMAVEEAQRCLNCKNKPCHEGCPVGIDIPGFISKVAERDFAGAYDVLSLSTTLAAVCGRNTQMNDLADLTEHYYDKGYWRSKKYTL